MEQQYEQLVKAHDKVCKKLPCSLTNLVRDWRSATEPWGMHQDTAERFLKMLKEENFQAASQEFISLMDEQLHKWCKIFSGERKISTCLRIFK